MLTGTRKSREPRLTATGEQTLFPARIPQILPQEFSGDGASPTWGLEPTETLPEMKTKGNLGTRLCLDRPQGPGAFPSHLTFLLTQHATGWVVSCDTAQLSKQKLTNELRLLCKGPQS